MAMSLISCNYRIITRRPAFFIHLTRRATRATLVCSGWFAVPSGQTPLRGLRILRAFTGSFYKLCRVVMNVSNQYAAAIPFSFQAHLSLLFLQARPEPHVHDLRHVSAVPAVD